MDADRWIKLVQTVIPFLQALIWPVIVYLILRPFTPSIKKFIDHSGKFSGKISPTGIEFSTEQLETTTGQVSASLTAASLSKETSNTEDTSNTQSSSKENKQVLSGEKVHEKVQEIGNAVAQALNPQIVAQMSKETLLWIEKENRDYTFELDAIKALGIKVTKSDSIEDALSKFEIKPFDIVVSTNVDTDNEPKPNDELKKKVFELFSQSYLILYDVRLVLSPQRGIVPALSWATDLTNIRVTEDPLTLFQYIVNAVKEKETPILTREAANQAEIAVTDWLGAKYFPRETILTFNRLFPDITAIQKNGEEIGVEIKYASSPLRANDIYKTIKGIKIPYKTEHGEILNKIVFVIVTSTRIVAENISYTARRWKDIPSGLEIIVGHLKEREFIIASKTSFFD